MPVIRNNIITVREAIGLEIFFSEGDKMEISGIHVAIEKGRVVKRGEIEMFSLFKDLPAKVSGNVPVAVTLSGKGVLMRFNKEKHTDNLISGFFPGSNPQDFVYAVHETQGAEHVVYIARRSLVESVVREIVALDIHLLSLTLGSAPADIVLPFMNVWNVSLKTPALSLGVSEQKLLSVKADSYDPSLYTIVEIGQQKYASNYILPLGAALGMVGKPVDEIRSDIKDSEIDRLQKEFMYYKLFRFAGWALLCGVFALLLVNFFVFNSFYNKNKVLLESSVLIDSKARASNGTNAQIDSSYRFFVEAGWSKPSRYAYYADRIAALMPATASLTGIQESPLQESGGLGGIRFSPDKILVKGVSTDPTELEIFSRSIRNIKGIVSVGIKTYLYKSELKAAMFVIEVNVEA